MLQNAYLVAKIGADTAENEQHLPKFCRSAVVWPTPAGSAATHRACDGESRAELRRQLAALRADHAALQEDLAAFKECAATMMAATSEKHPVLPTPKNSKIHDIL